MADPAEPQNDPMNPSEETPVETQEGADSEMPTTTTPKWPGWPGDNVFRLIVPVLKVGSIIGRKGELVKKLCDETRARVRVLDAPVGTPDRVVSISLIKLLFLYGLFCISRGFGLWVSSGNWN